MLINKDLTTSYTVADNILRQTVDFKNAIFPVVADPIWCGDAISNVSWGYNGSDRSAAVVPTWCGRLSNGSLAWAWNAWGEMYNKTPYDWSWNWAERAYGTSKYWSMYNQFACHFVNPLTIPKSSWNLEPRRPDVGWAATYAAGCNPN
jgi:hypothetical protein